MLRKEIKFFGQPVIVACDGNCSKAWGINIRPMDKIERFLTDDELGIAPVNPGTYEGNDGKPIIPEDVAGQLVDGDPRLNRWCVRECERSDTFNLGDPIDLPDFSVRKS